MREATVITTVFWFFVAFLFAALEIEIEGKYGWAEKLPTWYRTTGLCGRLFGIFNSGRPLTGYHSFMLLVTVALFHAAYFQGLQWTLAEETKTLALYFAWVPCWDFLWFVLNPNYGWSRFRQDSVWWFAKSKWLFGWPLDYYVSWSVSIGLVYASSLLGADTSLLREHLVRLAVFGGMTAIAVVAAPLYRRWYHYMRQSDDREKAGIFHR